MSAPVPIGGIALPMNIGGPPPTPGLAPAPSLVPKPTLAVGSIESLYALMAEANSQQQKTGKNDVEGKFEAKRVALENYKAEVAKAEEEQREGGGFFKVFATVAMVVVAAAATVCTCGAAGPVVVGVGLALSAGGFLVNQTKCFGDASAWIGAGMQLCGAVVTCGAALASSGAAAATTAEQAAETAAKIGEGAEAASAIAQGAGQVDSTLREHRADQHMQKAAVAQQQMRRLQDAIGDVIEHLQDAKDASRRGATAVNEIVETEGQTLVLSAGGRA